MHLLSVGNGGTFSFELSLGWEMVAEGITRRDLGPVFPLASLVAVGLWRFSITGFFI